MSVEPNHEKLRASVRSAVKKIDRADRERATLAAQTVYVGVLGLLFVLPIVSGAYLGHWLDCKTSHYAYGWTIGLILAGVAVGAVNVYLFVRE